MGMIAAANSINPCQFVLSVQANMGHICLLLVNVLGPDSFVRGSVLGQDTSEPSLVLVKPKKDMKYWQGTKSAINQLGPYSSTIIKKISIVFFFKILQKHVRKVVGGFGNKKLC